MGFRAFEKKHVDGKMSFFQIYFSDSEFLPIKLFLN